MHALLKHPLVDCDLEEAALWYDRRSPVVAERLIAATQNAMRRIAEDPYRFSICFGKFRRMRIRGFQHAIYFKVADDRVVVLALIHGARDVEAELSNRDPSSSEE